MMTSAAPAQWVLNQNEAAARERAWVEFASQPLYNPQERQIIFTTNEGAESVPQEPTRPLTRGVDLRSFPALASLYAVANPIAVEAFLHEHRGLVKVLFSAFPRIRSIWTAEVEPELTLVADPEGGFPVLIVRLSSNSRNPYEALDRFDEDWWLDHINETDGLLNFSLRTQDEL